MATAAELQSGLESRGLPSHIARAFVVNFQSESGLKPNAVEGVPNVHGTRGFGLYQLTDTAPGRGRLTDYRNYVAGNGKTFGSVDSQLDFLMHELNTTEKSAARKIFSQTTTAGAAQSIVSDFLRPSKKYELQRRAEYANLDGSGPAVTGEKVAQSSTVADGVPSAASVELSASQEVARAIDQQTAANLASQQAAQTQSAGVAETGFGFAKDIFGRIAIVILGVLFVGAGLIVFAGNSKAGELAAAVIPGGKALKKAL